MMKAKKEQAIVALIKHGSVAAAAEACEIGERTLYRWLNEAEFLTAYRAARADLVEAALAELQGDSKAAVDTLRQLLNSTKETIQLRAAQTIIEHALRAVELASYEQRLTEIEAALGHWLDTAARSKLRKPSKRSHASTT